MAQANITLSALTGDDSFGQRSIILSPHRLTIPVGRASKTVSKGILGAEDNAWFDSPVMSREHAELCLNTIVKSVAVCDLGSMHGTYINDIKVLAKQPVDVEDGDIITFGTEVTRGMEIIPACSFQININWSQYRAVSSTFSVPDSSDIEEDEGYGFSEPDMETHGQTSSDGAISIETPQRSKPYDAITAIDLTGDDSPIRSSSFSGIDLTGDDIVDLSTKDRVVESMSDHPVALGLNGGLPGDKTHPQNRTGLNIIVEDDLLSSESDDEPFVVQDSGSEDTDASDDLLDYGEEESNEESGSEDGDQDENISDTAKAPIESMMRRFYAIGGSPRSPLPEDDDSMDEDNDSDLGLSEAGAEGLRALFEDGLQQSTAECQDTYLNTTAAAEVGHSTGNTLPSLQMSKEIHVPIMHSMDSLCSPVSNLVQGTLETRETMAESVHFLGARQPSPSDAAMAKATSQQQPQQTTNDSHACHLQSQEPSESSRSLGERTGKLAFFEAREMNKARFLAPSNTTDERSAEPSTSNDSTVPSNTVPPEEEPQSAKALAPTNPWVDFGGVRRPLGDLTSARTQDNPIRLGRTPGVISMSTMLTAIPTGKSVQDKEEQTSSLRPSIAGMHLNSSIEPHNEPQSTERASPDLDMTSAVKFNESKAKFTRSKLSIHDIIESSSRDQSTQLSDSRAGSKRKASEISDVLADEMRAWASSKDATKPEDQIVPTYSPEISYQSVEPIATPALNERPAKKLKTFLERAAFAAVGGVTVGAGLFFSLVATAPDFS